MRWTRVLGATALSVALSACAVSRPADQPDWRQGVVKRVTTGADGATLAVVRHLHGATRIDDTVRVRTGATVRPGDHVSYDHRAAAKTLRVDPPPAAAPTGSGRR